MTIENVLQDVNNIELDHDSLMDIFLFYYERYIERTSNDEPTVHPDLLEKMWDHPAFVRQAVSTARDGLVIGMMAVSMGYKKPDNYQHVLEHCNNLDKLGEDLTLLKTEFLLSKQDNEALTLFFVDFQKDVFTRTYSQNKDLQKVSGIPYPALQERHKNYLTQINLFLERQLKKK